MQVTDLSTSKDRGPVFSQVNLEQTSLNIYEQLFFRFCFIFGVFLGLFLFVWLFLFVSYVRHLATVFEILPF